MQTRLLLIIFTLYISGTISADKLYFDLADTYIVGSGWNTVTHYGTELHVVNAVDSTGVPTSVAYNCVDAFTLGNSSGDSGVTAYPIEAGRDSFYLSSSNNYAKILIGGLTPGNSYDFTFFGSRASSGPRAVDITIGTQSVYLDAAYNTSTVVSINGVVADAGGVVEIEVSLASNSSFGYLGVIEINGEFGQPVVEEPGIFVAPWGLDSNPGTYSWPKGTLQGAAAAVEDYKQANGLPEGGLDVYFRGGHYYFSATTILDDQHSGEAGKPVTFKPYNHENVVFDGSVVINSSGFSVVTDPLVLDRMGDEAAGNVYGCYITGTSLRDQLSEVYAVLDLDGRMAQVSRYPNVGNCHIASVLDEGAIYAHGRTPGDPPTYDMDNSIGAEFTLIETNAARWETEFATVKKAQVTGYLDNDWYKETHRIADINAGVITLLEYSRYGVSSAGARRLYVLNFLCELDSPGEFYFDEATNMLYIWPYEPITPESNIGVWNGPEFVKLYCSYVNFEDFIIQGTTEGGSGSGMVTFYAGDHVEFSGCTFRNTSRPAVSFMRDCTTTNSGIIGCDLYDASSHLNLYGGVADADEITPAGNYAINCHFTQVQSRDYLGRIYARGVGNILRNNLIHNLPDDPIKNGGNDNVIELNEVFNCGFESGDGGGMYWAACMWSYGNVFRHNFLHHLMCTPGLHAKGGMYPDQLDAGDRFEENVFYKAAHRAILLNGGAGHSVLRNVFLNGSIGLYQTEAYAQKWYNEQPLYDDGTLTRGDVGDFIWRTEQVVGADCWNNEPWLSHYPMFVTVMNQEMMRFWPIENYFIDNMFYGNSESNFLYRFEGGSTTTDFDLTPSYIHTSGNRDIGMDLFEDTDALNFKFAEPRPSYAPDIPFENVGLYVGDGRKRVPHKNVYRKLVKDQFEGRASYNASISYDPATVNDLIYWNSGQILMDLQNAGDFDSDWKMNFIDYSYLAECWQESEPSLTPADATGAYAYWPLDNGTGNTATDTSENGYDGTIAGAGWSGGRFDNALFFDGVDDKVAIPALNLNSNTITLTAWIKREGTQDNATPIFYTRSSSTPDAGVILTSDGRLWGRWNGTWETTLQTPDGQWAFIAFVVEPDNLTMYLGLDGSTSLSMDSKSGSYSPEEFDGLSYFGSDQNYPTTRYLTGMLDDIRVYNTALTKSELEQMLQQYHQADDAWPCNEADFNRNGIVDLEDLSVFISHWLSR